MNVNEFLKVKTNYIGIGIMSILFCGILLLLILIETLAFFLIYGSGATSSRIAKLWYVDLILNYLPILIVGGFLVFRIKKEYYKEELVKFKTNLITLLILMLLFALRNHLEHLIF
ncbi:hypothetical protein P8625_00910 [Tenacibaculum tangerinum]|uniref:Uncharacterized protein n=1 Tax=Tenacibaculum tangerinum TaxID=3038772 RepID=A0ABY8L3B0_9FLAO|nr:hypothetical protein [Tenacibaculum tangerinum]WGH75754.1 hypothetical protein P8625_00910 [Tenacibaculum tangerinum]